MSGQGQATSPEMLLAGVENPANIYEQTIDMIRTDGLGAARNYINEQMGSVPVALDHAAEQNSGEQGGSLFAGIRNRFTGRGGRLATLGVTGSFALAGCGVNSGVNERATGADGTSEGVAGPTGKCPDTWQQKELKDKESHRVIEDGLPSGKSREVVANYVDTIRGDKDTFRGVYKVATHKNTKRGKLFDAKGCATDYAEEKYDNLVAGLAAATIQPSKAPRDGVNSGLNRGELVQARQAGISGNRKAVKVEMKDGTVFWILDRCGNPVTEGAIPGVPSGPTDQPKTPPGRTPLIRKVRDHSTLPGAKRPNRDDPLTRGHPDATRPKADSSPSGVSRQPQDPEKRNPAPPPAPPSSVTQGRPAGETTPDPGPTGPAPQVPGTSNDPSGQGGQVNPDVIAP